ncbi:hypothetical protein [Haladaptatus sp. DYF46]|uniref:hypothetical protein n=1 Tax=Haladaptatus sp. DYF46 TaxID=2886041 RepID=UPI001E6599F6|nr:hypothetical protein [Haladaptatus sp. DYF46]
MVADATVHEIRTDDCAEYGGAVVDGGGLSDLSTATVLRPRLYIPVDSGESVLRNPRIENFRLMSLDER